MKTLCVLVFLVFLTGFALGATRYVSPTGSDSNSCTTSSRCATINRAYQLSANGDTVLMQSGSYGDQTITRNTSLTGSSHVAPNGTEVTVKPESGTVTVNGVSLSGGGFFNITFQDLNVPDGGGTGNTSTTNVHIVGGHWGYNGGEAFFIGSTSSTSSAYFSFQGAEMGPTTVTCTGPNSANKILHFWGANNILVEGSTLHDYTAEEGCGIHPDAIESCGAPCGIPVPHDITIRKSNFYNNACDNFRLSDDGQTNMVIENNYFGPSVTFEGGCGYVFQLGGVGGIIRYNTLDGPPQMGNPSDSGNQQWTGNIINALVNNGQCPVGSGTVSQYNVLKSGNATTCGGATNTIVSNMTGWFVNPSVGNYDLTATAVAPVGAGNPSNFPVTDIHGTVRTSPPTAGAFQAASGARPNPPTNLTVTVR